MFSNKGDKELICDNCPLLLLTQTLFCLPLSHTVFLFHQHHPSHQVGLPLRANRHLPCGLSKKWLVVFFRHVCTCPSGAPGCFSGGLAWEWGLLSGHDPPLKGKRDKGAEFLQHKSISILCGIGSFKIG